MDAYSTRDVYFCSTLQCHVCTYVVQWMWISAWMCTLAVPLILLIPRVLWSVICNSTVSMQCLWCVCSFKDRYTCNTLDRYPCCTTVYPSSASMIMYPCSSIWMCSELVMDVYPCCAMDVYPCCAMDVYPCCTMDVYPCCTMDVYPAVPWMCTPADSCHGCVPLFCHGYVPLLCHGYVPLLCHGFVHKGVAHLDVRLWNLKAYYYAILRDIAPSVKKHFHTNSSCIKLAKLVYQIFKIQVCSSMEPKAISQTRENVINTCLMNSLLKETVNYCLKFPFHHRL